MSSRFTITLGVCLVAGVAAGIGLARPGNVASSSTAASGSAPAASAPVAGGSPDSSAPAAPGRPGYKAAGSGSTAPPAAGSGSRATTPAAPAPAVVTISDFAFSPTNPVKPGSSVQVVNGDSVDHTLTAEDRSFDSGNLASGGRATIAAPAAPGTYSYFCAIHPSMHGTITVAA